MLGSTRLAAHKILFLGAGEAGVGIADLVVAAMVADGLSPEDSRRRCWFVDSKGLVVGNRDLAEHKRPYAHDHEPLPDLLSAVKAIEPTALIGVSGQPQTFTRPVIEAMTAINERPVIFALSNPTVKAECTAEQAYVERRPGNLCERKSFCAGRASGEDIRAGTGEQRLHLSRRRPGCHLVGRAASHRRHVLPRGPDARR